MKYTPRLEPRVINGQTIMVKVCPTRWATGASRFPSNSHASKKIERKQTQQNPNPGAQ